MNQAQQREFERIVRPWGLVLEGPIIVTPNGLIGFGRRGDESVVVKVPSADGDEAASAAVLRHFRGQGAVRILDRQDGAMLLECASPGRPLTDLVIAGRDDEATTVLCDVVAALHRPGPPKSEFPGIDDWGCGFNDYRRSHDTTIPAAMVDRADALFVDLAASQASPVLLHGDLHHDNILFDNRRGWLAIDPKGVVGEPAYEFGAALRNPTEDTALFATPAIVDRRTRIISERLGLDRRRLMSWCFTQAVLSAIWAIEDGSDTARWLATADAVLPAL